MTFFEKLVWYSGDFLEDLAVFLLSEPFVYLVGFAVLFFITGIVKRIMSV